MIITKSIELSSIYERDGKAYAEGWISPDTRDLEKDEVPPEAFISSLDGFFERGAPVSCEHDTQPFPAGYMQKAVLVRDGQIFHTALHPVDPGDFEAFPEQGTGWYGRVVIDEPKTAQAVKKGKIRSFSWIGRLAEKEAIPDGRWRFKRVDPLIEATVSAYPVNPSAIMTIAKATQPPKEIHMDPEQITTLITDILARREAEKEALTKKASEEAAMKALLEKVEALEKKNADLEEEVKKAQVPQREAGVGRKGAPASEDQDPIAYLMQKALKQEQLTSEDKDLIARLTVAYLTQGMTE